MFQSEHKLFASPFGFKQDHLTCLILTITDKKHPLETFLRD